MTYRYFFRLGILLVMLMVMAGWAGEVSAAPAAPTEFELAQPDGSTFTARLWGDEWQNGYETDAGYSILLESDGWWVYAAAAKDGSLAPQLQESQERLLVGKSSPEGLTPHLRPEEKSIPQDAHQVGFAQNLGNQPTLVLLAEFSNTMGTTPGSYFADTFFSTSSSVKDYYLKASFNQLALSPAAEAYGSANDGIVGWLNLGLDHPNTGGSVDDRNKNIVKNALIASDDYVNYAAFDTNNNNYISQNELHIVVVVAGFEAAYGGAVAFSVWAHQWDLDSVGPPTLDGKVLGNSNFGGGYAQFGEIHGDHPATIGIIAHELGHDLSWPDLYDTDLSSEGVGDWSIMGGGSWNNTTGGKAGDSPALPDAWLKWYQGWITPIAINGTQMGVTINQAETNPQAYLLGPNPGGVDWNFLVTSGSGEFFLVENRQLTGYDVGLPGCGLLITHIDESVTFDNDANANEFHPLVKIIEADGLNELQLGDDRGDSGDPFPGSTNNQTFNFSSTPNSRLYNNSDSQAVVTSISGCSPSMTAMLTYGSVPMNNKVFLPLITNGVPPAPGVDPIRNGSFEAGRDGNWIESSPGSYELITNDLPIAPHSGSWASWLGGVLTNTDSLTQTGIQLGSLRYLHYWYWIASSDICGFDYAKIYINGAQQVSRDLCNQTGTGGWVHGMLDLNAFLGTTISLEFRVTTNFEANSNFFLDDVSLSVSTAFSPAETVPLLTGNEAGTR